jgi:hypothetical protein
MGGYIGTTKRDIKNLMDSVSEPGVSVRRETRTKPIYAVMGGPNVLYHFHKNGAKLFTICVSPKGNDVISSDFYQWASLEATIVCGGKSSDVICEGDDAFREMRVLCQLAEKMYEEQSPSEKIQQKRAQLNIQIKNELLTHKK